MKKLISVILVAVMAATLVFTLASCAALTKEGFIEICETAEAKKAEVQKDSVTVTVSATFKAADGNYWGLMISTTRNAATVDGVTKLRIDEDQSILSGTDKSAFNKVCTSQTYFDGKDSYVLVTADGTKTTSKTENTTAVAVLEQNPVAARKNNRGSSLDMSDFSANEYSGEKSYIYTCKDEALFSALVKEYAAYLFGENAAVSGLKITDGKGIYTVASDGCVHFDYIKLTGDATVDGTAYLFEYESSIKTVAEGDAVVVEPIPDMGTLFPDKPAENTEVSEESGEDGQEYPDPEPDEKG